MNRQRMSVLVGLVVALSLLAAPVTMGDWSEQAIFSVQQVDPADVKEDTPVLHFDELSPDAQHAVRQAITDPDGMHRVYGVEDWPSRFYYSDTISPGAGLYVVVYQGQHYRLTTSAMGGFLFVYWLLELPFVLYGFLLGWLSIQTNRDTRRRAFLEKAILPGVAFHLLGPELDFPIVEPMVFSALGVLAVFALTVAIVNDRLRHRPNQTRE